MMYMEVSSLQCLTSRHKAFDVLHLGPHVMSDIEV